LRLLYSKKKRKGINIQIIIIDDEINKKVGVDCTQAKRV
jgi:hypothetical protein